MIRIIIAIVVVVAVSIPIAYNIGRYLEAKHQLDVAQEGVKKAEKDLQAAYDEGIALCKKSPHKERIQPCIDAANNYWDASEKVHPEIKGVLKRTYS
jgi:hypothetical protein